MDANTLCDILKQRIPPEKFQIWGPDVHWVEEPTKEEQAIVDDVIANYTALAAGILAEQMKKQAINAIQAILDAKAKEFGFDSIHTGAIWTISKNPARKARADALIAWGDKWWDYAEAEEVKQAKGESTFQTVEEFLAGGPVFGE